MELSEKYINQKLEVMTVFPRIIGLGTYLESIFIVGGGGGA